MEEIAFSYEHMKGLCYSVGRDSSGKDVVMTFYINKDAQDAIKNNKPLNGVDPVVSITRKNGGVLYARR